MIHKQLLEAFISVAETCLDITKEDNPCSYWTDDAGQLWYGVRDGYLVPVCEEED